MTREEIELLSRISKRLVEEKDPDQFTNLVLELEGFLLVNDVKLLDPRNGAHVLPADLICHAAWVRSDRAVFDERHPKIRTEVHVVCCRRNPKAIHPV